MRKKWRIRECNENRISEIESKYNLNHLVAQKLAEKDLKDEEIEIFLNPTRKDFYNPYDLPDMEKAIDRIIKAIDKLHICTF